MSGEEYDGEGSGQELFGESDENDCEEQPILTYKQYRMSSTMAKRVILQTSDSSDNDDDNNRHKKQPRVSIVKNTRDQARKDVVRANNIRLATGTKQ